MNNGTQAAKSTYHLSASRTTEPTTGWPVTGGSGGLQRCRIGKIICGVPVSSATITVYDGPKNAATPVVKAVLSEYTGVTNEWDLDDGQFLNGIYLDTSVQTDDIYITYIG